MCAVGVNFFPVCAAVGSGMVLYRIRVGRMMGVSFFPAGVVGDNEASIDCTTRFVRVWFIVPAEVAEALKTLVSP